MTQEVTSTHPWQESHCHPVRWLMMVITTFYWGWFNFNKNVKHLRTTRTTKTKWLYFRTAVTLMKRFCKENPVERIGYQKDGVHDIKKHRWFQVRRKFLLWNSFTAMVFDVDASISILFIKLYRVSQKKCSHVWEAINPAKKVLQSKVRGVLKSSGNSLSDGHWNFCIWTIRA